MTRAAHSGMRPVVTSLPKRRLREDVEDDPYDGTTEIHDEGQREEKRRRRGICIDMRGHGLAVARSDVVLVPRSERSSATSQDVYTAVPGPWLASLPPMEALDSAESSDEPNSPSKQSVESVDDDDTDWGTSTGMRTSISLSHASIRLAERRVVPYAYHGARLHQLIPREDTLMHLVVPQHFTNERNGCEFTVHMNREGLRAIAKEHEQRRKLYADPIAFIDELAASPTRMDVPEDVDASGSTRDLPPLPPPMMRAGQIYRLGHSSLAPYAEWAFDHVESQLRSFARQHVVLSVELERAKSHGSTGHAAAQLEDLELIAPTPFNIAARSTVPLAQAKLSAKLSTIMQAASSNMTHSSMNFDDNLARLGVAMANSPNPEKIWVRERDSLFPRFAEWMRNMEQRELPEDDFHKLAVVAFFVELVWIASRAEAKKRRKPLTR
ncbi:hypothetical protein BKA62DRAFT_715000 [Auriculariales sp. MPI-PUGE-AT-0066]|nr:hypothetical protein BKA62DRAFT_715000 [Auriculariales sp. MPI-PUGE-AT-0066]